ncbi:MAG: SEC-C domain-containing protein [Gemmatimonadetes bacterium]|nr:SEC-C domain-containing protein [Gemmatimonadota bacterium]
MFVDFMTDIRKSVASLVFRTQLAVPEPPPPPRPRGRLLLSGPSDTPSTRPLAAQPAAQEMEEMDTIELAAAAGGGRSGRGALMRGLRPRGPDLRQLQTNRGEGGALPRPVTAEEKVGRNDPCPCGSGKKYKKCCGVGAV